MRPLEEVLEEAGRFFMGESPIHKAAARITNRLDEMGVPFAVVGAMAVNAHGHVRTTDDLDVLLTREGLAAFKKEWVGRGWVEKFKGSKGLRDAVVDVKVDVLLAGEFPGDGKPKPIVFPDPGAVTLVRSELGFPVLDLDLILELKMASGLTALHRMQDFADAMNLIKKNQLPKNHGESHLDPFVHEKYLELWGYAQIEEDF